MVLLVPHRMRDQCVPSVVEVDVVVMGIVLSYHKIS